MANIKLDGLTVVSTAGNPTQLVYPAGGSTPISIAIVADKKSSGTSGGQYSADQWTTRTLDDEEFDPENVVTLANNQFTLISGKYYIKYFTTAFYSNSAFSRLYDHTNSTVIVYGTDAHPSKDRSGVYDHTNSLSHGSCYLSITTPTAYSIDFYPDALDSNNGGAPASTTLSGVDVYFTKVDIMKIG